MLIDRLPNEVSTKAQFPVKVDRYRRIEKEYRDFSQEIGMYHECFYYGIPSFRSALYEIITPETMKEQLYSRFGMIHGFY